MPEWLGWILDALRKMEGRRCVWPQHDVKQKEWARPRGRTHLPKTLFKKFYTLSAPRNSCSSDILNEGHDACLHLLVCDRGNCADDVHCAVFWRIGVFI